MPIDPSIPLSIRPPTPGPSILDTYAQITQLQQQKLAGEERRAAAQDAQAKRQREAQIEAAFQEAIVLDPVTQQPTVDYAKLLGRNVPASALFEVKKIIDATGEQAAKLQETNLSVEQKKAVYNAGIARATAAAGYDPDAFRFAIVGAKKIGALSQEETDALLDAAERDPASIQRWATGAIARAGGEKTQLEQITTVDEQGRPVTRFVTPTAGASYLQAPKASDSPALGTLGDYLARVAREVGRPVVALTPAQVAKAKAEFEAAGRAPREPRDERIVSVIGPDGKPIYVRESAALGKTPGSAAAGGEGGLKLSAAQQEDIATMLTVEQLAQDVQAIDKQAGQLPGVGPTEGRLFPSARGSGGAVGETLRNKIGNIQGTIAKLRGGTSFTPSEQALLDTYTPTITDTDAAIRTKIASLTDFIQKKRANTLRVASGQYELPPTPTGGGGGTTAAAPGAPIKIGRFEVEVR